MDQEPLDSLVIELADTRPTMAWLPWLGEVPNGIAALLFSSAGICLSLLGLKFTLWVFPAWFGLSRLIALDYHALTRWNRWIATSAWTFDADDYGGASVSPRVGKVGRGM